MRNTAYRQITRHYIEINLQLRDMAQFGFDLLQCFISIYWG